MGPSSPSPGLGTSPSHINRFQPLRDHFGQVPTTALLLGKGHGLETLLSPCSLAGHTHQKSRPPQACPAGRSICGSEVQGCGPGVTPSEDAAVVIHGTGGLGGEGGPVALGTSTHSDGWGLTQGAGRVGVGRARAPVIAVLRWRGDGTGGQESHSYQRELPWGYGTLPQCSAAVETWPQRQVCIPDVEVRPSPPGSFLQGQASPGPPLCGHASCLLPSSQELEGGCGRVRLRTRPLRDPPAPQASPARSLPPRPHPRPGPALLAVMGSAGEFLSPR